MGLNPGIEASFKSAWGVIVFLTKVGMVRMGIKRFPSKLSAFDAILGLIFA